MWKFQVLRHVDLVRFQIDDMRMVWGCLGRKAFELVTILDGFTLWFWAIDESILHVIVGVGE
jgi:hypothetical protein